MRTFTCQCGNILFFDNSVCLQCQLEVGYDPASDEMKPLDENFQRCANGSQYGVCNWLVPTGTPDTLCLSCRLNRTIPDLNVPGNHDAWHRIELAKRRTLFTLAHLGLRPPSKLDDSEQGLAFDFLRPDPGCTVLTGHDDGVITLNVDEAEGSTRERQRELLGESWRTLSGHFAHESAHYYWDRFFRGRPDDDPYVVGFRTIFGDDRKDYAAELARHYSQGPSGAAASPEFISAYAAVHPWEDWAEVWSHYLHMIDGTETARNFGFDSKRVRMPFTPLPEDAASLPESLEWESPDEGPELLGKLHAWAKLAPAINELGASLGHPNLYPFVFSGPIIRKFCFVHHVIRTLAAVVPAAPIEELAAAEPVPSAPSSPIPSPAAKLAPV